MSAGQNCIFDPDEDKKNFIWEDLDIEFDFSNSFEMNQPSGEDHASQKKFTFLGAIPAILTALPSLVDIGFKLTTKLLEEKVKEFTAECTKQKSNVSAGNKLLPNLVFKRRIILEDEPGAEKIALMIGFKAVMVKGIQGFCYYIDTMEHNFSGARPTKKFKTFDYIIELKPTFLVAGVKHTQDLSPLAISSIGFGKTKFDTGEYKHRTDIILIPDGAFLTEVSIKIIESNPSKVRAENILSLWNDNKDSVKTIINNILPKEKEQEK